MFRNLTQQLLRLLYQSAFGFQDETYALPNEARAKCSSVCQLQYCLQRCQSEPSYEVKYISLGAGMACIAASFDGSRITTLNVSLEQHLHLQQTGTLC